MPKLREEQISCAVYPLCCSSVEFFKSLFREGGGGTEPQKLRLIDSSSQEAGWVEEKEAKYLSIMEVYYDSNANC